MKRTILTIIVCLALLSTAAKKVTSRIPISNAASKSKIENIVKRVPGVSDVTFYSSTKMLTVTYDNKKTNTTKIRTAIQKAGFHIGSQPAAANKTERNTKAKNNHNP